MSEDFKPDSHIAEELAVGVPPPQDMLTQEQIESRHRLVTLHRETKEGMYSSNISFVEGLSVLPADEAREKIRELRRIAQETGNIPLELQEYNAYVADLREIRAEQREHIAQELDKVPADASHTEKREVFIMALDHSPPLATRTLEKINKLASTGSSFLDTPKKIFRDDQLTEISQDPEKFKQALTQMIIDEPDMVFRVSTIMETVASPEEIRSALDSLKDTDPDALLGHLPYVMQHYTRDEARSLITTLAEKSPDSALYRIVDDKILELIGEETVSRIAQKALESDFLPHISVLETCIQKGFISKEEVKARVLRDIEPAKKDEESQDLASVVSFRLSNVEDLLQSDLVSAEEKKEIHDKVLSLLQTADDNLFRLMEYTSILTHEEKVTLFEAKFAADPIGAVEKYASMVSSFIEPQIARETILRYISETGPEAYNNSYSILHSSALSIDDKRTFLHDMSQQAPGKIFEVLRYVDGSFSEAILNGEEITEMLHGALAASDLPTISLYLDSIVNYASPDDLKNILATQFNKSPSLDLFKSRNKEILNSLFTQEEQLNMLERSIEAQLTAFGEGDNTLHGINFGELQGIFSEDVIKNLADRIRAISPETFISNIGNIKHLYDPQEVTNFVLDLAQSLSGQKALLTDMMFEYGNDTKWNSVVDKEVVRTLLLNADPELYRNVILNNDKLERYLSQDDIQNLASKMLATNPIIAIGFPEFFTEHVQGFNPDSVLEGALQNPAHMSVLGKYFTETLQRAQKTDRDVVFNRLLKDAEYMYTLIERQSRSGSLEGFKTLHDKFELNAKTERALFETYSIIATLGTSEDVASLGTIDTIAGIEQVATRAVARSLGIESNISLEQSQKLLEQLGSITPIGLYVSQYASSAGHAEVLRPMVQALLDGNYDAWKYGTGPEAFSAMKAAGLLPQNLSGEQYAAWQQETQTERTETFTVETSAVIEKIRTILNDEELQLPAGSLVSATEKTLALDTIASTMPGLGKEIASIHQEIKLLKEQPDQELAMDQIESLERSLDALDQTRRELQIQQDVIQLTNLTEEEVRSGIVQQGGGKGRPLTQVVQRLRKNLGTDVEYVTNGLSAALDSYKEQTGSAQTLLVRDTASPRITVEIGELPLTSCQNYRNGIMNQALMGYTDPNTKILLLSNERGNPIARSVFRILSDESGNPVLHAETIYTTEASDGVSRAMYQHAIEKAKAMGIPLYISSVSQNDEGHMVGTRDIEGITRTETESVLSSAGSRAPSVYVDSAGGEQRGGVYSFTNVVTLT